MARRFDRTIPRLTAEGDLPVNERRFANGMKALVLPRRSAPVVVSDLYYPVGSFDEPARRTGLAHFVEHMLFKGTDRFPKGRIDHLVLAAAGHCNAETGEDSTHYWFVLPADRWELALEIEADRMRGARFDPAEIELERRVIREERARELNSPQGRLDQNHLAVTYARHPYRNPILGWPEDLARIGASDLTRFYRRHYRPDGAVLVVVGDVDPDAAFERIESSFGRPPVGPTDRASRQRGRGRCSEPSQSHRRDFTMAEADGTARGLLGWRTVPRGHVDVPSLDVLSDILSCGRRSRLFQSLVERDDLAYWVEATHYVAQRGGQFLIQIEAEAAADRSEIERRVQEEARRLASEGPTSAELERSRHRLEAAWRWEREDLTGLAAGLGHAALWGDWRDWPREHQAAMAVDRDAVRHVAAHYLREAGLTAGWSAPGLTMALGALSAGADTNSDTDANANAFAPKASREGPSRSPSPSIAVAKTAAGPGLIAPDAPDVRDGPQAACRAARLVDYRPRRVVLDNGMRLTFERRSGAGVVAMELYVDAGSVREAKPGLAALTGRLLEEGTELRSADAIAEAIENVGGSIEVGATGGSARARAEDLELALDLLAEMVLRPAFPSQAVQRVARRLSGELRADLDDPAFRADLAFRRLIYGDHPLGRDARGGARELARLTRNDVREHHRRHFVPEGAALVVTGDFDPRRLARLVERRFGDWRARARARPPLPRVGAPVGPARRRRVVCPGDQAHVLLGHLGVARDHPDYDALVVLDHIFGSGPGFSDRLGRIVRDEMGLAYAIGGGMTDSADRLPGIFRVYAGTTPAEVEHVVAVVTEQVRALRAGEFSDEEVERARAYVAGAWIFDYQTVEQRAERLLELERFRLPLDHPQTWPDRIAALSPKRARRAARDHLRPESLCRLVLGPRLQNDHARGRGRAGTRGRRSDSGGPRPRFEQKP